MFDIVTGDTFSLLAMTTAVLAIASGALVFIYAVVLEIRLDRKVSYKDVPGTLLRIHAILMVLAFANFFIVGLIFGGLDGFVPYSEMRWGYK